MDKHINLIRKIAWSFHNTTGIEWRELFAEASLAYCIALKTHDPEKGKLPPYISGVLNKHLLMFLEKERRDKFVTLDEGWMERVSNQTPWFEVLETMSDDCKTVINLILDDPHKYLEVSSKEARGRVLLHLTQTNKWTYVRSHNVIRQMKLAVNKLT